VTTEAVVTKTSLSTGYIGCCCERLPTCCDGITPIQNYFHFSSATFLPFLLVI